MEEFTSLPNYFDYRTNQYDGLDNQIPIIMRQLKIKRQTYVSFIILQIGVLAAAFVVCFILGQEIGIIQMKIKALNEGAAIMQDHPDGAKFKFLKIKN